MKIQFIKIAKYGGAIKLHDKYDFYCKSAFGIIDPDVDYPINLSSRYCAGQFSEVHSSPLQRARSLASYLSNKVNIVDELREIQFDLAKLVSRGEFERLGSEIVRERFVRAFITDTLFEKRRDIVRRLERLITKLRGESIVAISHSFAMKLIQAIHEGCDLINYPEKLFRYINIKQRTFSYGEGFEIRYNEGKI